MIETNAIRRMRDRLDLARRSPRRVASNETTAWPVKALMAWDSPDGVEIGVRDLISGLATYGDVHSQSGWKIGDDGVLGPAFKAIAESILTLLNGELGRFDGGTLDQLVRDICQENGVELES